MNTLYELLHYIVDNMTHPVDEMRTEAHKLLDRLEVEAGTVSADTPAAPAPASDVPPAPEA